MDKAQPGRPRSLRLTVLDTYLGIAHESPEEKVLTFLIELGAQFVDAHEGSLLVVDEASKELVFAMTVGREASEEALLGQKVPVGKGLVGLAAQTRGFGFKSRNFGGCFPGKRSQKPFLDCGGQGCLIISGKI